MTLQEYKQKILEEFDKEWDKQGDVFKFASEYLSQAIDSTAEETYEAVKLEEGEMPFKSWDVAIQSMEDKYKEFKTAGKSVDNSLTQHHERD